MSHTPKKTKAIRGQIRPLRHIAKKEAREVARKANRRQWSNTRPEKPNDDDLLPVLINALNRKNISTWDKADLTGLSTSTLYAYSKGKTRHPQATSLQMIAKALGGKLAFIKNEKE